MPLTLRKACHACSKAKRKCIPQLPSCERCLQKGLECTYDLEPVQQDGACHDSSPTTSPQGSVRSSQPINIVYNSVECAREASIAAVSNGEAINSSAARPLLLSEGATSTWLLQFFLNVARYGIAEQRSPFIHSRIFRREISCLHDLNHSSHEHEGLKILDRLIEVQKMIVQALSRLLFDRQSVKKDVDIERIVLEMFTTTQQLWQEAPPNIADLFNAWDAWLVAESIRRSMFAAIMVKGIFWMATHGVLRYEPFYESFPFDPRSGLWEADTAERWRELIVNYGGHHTDLLSYHEFITQGKGRLDRSQDGEFQRMLFVCYHSAAGIIFLEEMDSIPIE